MRANIWIRAEDKEKWSQIENKSEFIHQALHRWPVAEAMKLSEENVKVRKRESLHPLVPKPIKTKQDAEKAVKPLQGVCEHGKTSGKCNQFNCPYFSPIKGGKK